MTEVMVCHFDGPQPYSTDFTGDPTGHLGQAATASGGVIYRPGRYGKAVQVAEAGTNLVLNPNANSVSNFNNAGDGSTIISLDSTSYYVGTSSIRGARGTTASIYIAAANVPIVNGAAAHTAYAFVNCDGLTNHNVNIAMFFRWIGGVNPAANSPSATVGVASDAVGKWLRVSRTITPDYADRTSCWIAPFVSGQSGSAYMNVDAVQFTQSSYALPYIDGGLGAGHSWSGTAHASTSSRTAATLTYDNLMSASEGGVVLGWIPAADSTTQPTSYLFDEGSFSAYFSSADKKIYFTDGTNTVATAALTFAAEERSHLAFSYSSAGLAIWRNGAQVASGSSYQPPTLGATFWLGSDTAGANQANGWFDELIVTDHVLTAAQVGSYYHDGVLRLVGERESINLLDPEGFYLARNGWRPQVAAEDDYDDYEDVGEKLRLEWMQDSDDDRAAAIQRLNRLLKLARQNDPRRRNDSLTPVYLEARAHGETEMRYAIVREGAVDELSQRIWGPARNVDAALQLVREGAWRAVVPRIHGLPWPVVTNQTIYNKEDGDGNNEIDIEPGDVPGDATALTLLKFGAGSVGTTVGWQYTVAQRRGVLADFDDFTPHFNVADATIGFGMTRVADTEAPDDERVEYSTAVANTIYWSLPGANISQFDGLYMVYAVFSANTSAEPTVRFETSDNQRIGEDKAIPQINLATYEGLHRIYLGTFEVVPRFPLNAAYASPHLLELHIENPTGATIYMHSMHLVPVTAPTFRFGPRESVATRETMVADGIWERVYQLNSSDQIYNLAPNLWPQGTYLRLRPNEHTRLYIFKNHEDSNRLPLVAANENAPASVWIVPRYLALRGAF